MIEIKVKNYTKKNSRKQPWYTVLWLKGELVKQGHKVNIVDSFTEESTLKIAVFSFKNLFFKQGDLYLMTFPLYSLSDIGLKELYLMFQYPKNFILIFIALFIPKWKISNEISIVLSEINLRHVHSESFYIFPLNSTDFESRTTEKRFDYCYYGPPYLTRGFNDVVNFIKKNQQFRYLIILRPDRVFTKQESKLIKKIQNEASVTLIIECMDYNVLMTKISESKNFLLPFPLVMSEGPTVLYEALQYGQVLTTKNAGINKDLIKNGIVELIGEKKSNPNRNIALEEAKLMMSRKNNKLIDFLNHEALQN